MILLTQKETDNRGITLVELLVSIAICVIVIGSIVYFMSYSSRNYKNASEDVSLQTEAQTILNQLNSLIMEANNVKYDSNILTIQHEDATYSIIFDTTTHELLFDKVLTGVTPVPTPSYKLFGKYVEDFQVDDTHIDNKNNKIGISIALRIGTNTYSIDNNYITLRNQIKLMR